MSQDENEKPKKRRKLTAEEKERRKCLREQQKEEKRLTKLAKESINQEKRQQRLESINQLKKQFKLEKQEMQSTIEKLTAENLSLQTIVRQLTLQNELLRKENRQLLSNTGSDSNAASNNKNNTIAVAAKSSNNHNAVDESQTKIDNNSNDNNGSSANRINKTMNVASSNNNNVIVNETVSQTFEIVKNLYQITDNKVFNFLLSWDTNLKSINFLSQTSEWNENKQMIIEQLRLCESQLQNCGIFGINQMCQNNEPFLLQHTIKESGQMGYQSYGSYHKLDFIILGCNYNNNIGRKEAILNVVSNINDDILNSIVNFLHQSIFMQVNYYETHDHTYDRDCHEMDDVDEYSIRIDFDPTFAIIKNEDNQFKSDNFKISTNWGHSSYTFSVKKELNADIFKSQLLAICDNLEVDINQYQALLAYLRQYYPKLI